MSEVQNEVVNETIETEFQPNAEGVLEPQSMEDKFFGVKNEVVTDNTEKVEVEIVDDTPEEDRRPPKKETKEEPVDDETVDKEITEYSKRAGDRINKIKYEFHEERRAKEAAQRIADEATKNLQTVMSENQRLQQLIEEGSKMLNNQAVSNAQFASTAATAEYKKAYEEGDADKMAEAQKKISQAALLEQQAPYYANQYVQQSQVQQPTVQETEVPKLDAAQVEWQSKNPWFMNNQDTKHRQMTSYAIYVHEGLMRDGVDPATQADKYYSSIDDKMRKEFPDFFGVTPEAPEVETEVVTEEKRQPSNVVAPATRNSGTNKNPRSIRLTQTQVNIARQLGITPEQYAKQILKEA